MFSVIKQKFAAYRGRWSMASLILAVFSIGLYVNWDFTGDWEGFYLLAGPGRRMTITDDLFPEDAKHLLGSMTFTWLKKAQIASSCDAYTGSCMDIHWNGKQGRGYVKNTFQDGSKLLINLSRFKNEEGELSSGIFLGGGLPASDPDFRLTNNDETGMTFFDGKRWNHIWCNVNEAVCPASDTNKTSFPQQWQFLGSRILENRSDTIVIVSKHRIIVDGVPIKVDKYFFYDAGDKYFTLVTLFTNTGSKPASFYYFYGDEPWVGHFGSSKGNIGWLQGSLVKTEQEIDTGINSYAGLLDYGNDLAGEHHNYTHIANFIEWDKPSRPDMAYYSNHAGSFSPETSKGAKVPLYSDTCRFLGLQWGPRTLQPQQALSITLAIGMAENDPHAGFPIKPVTSLN